MTTQPIVHKFDDGIETIAAEDACFCQYPPLQRAVSSGVVPETAIVFTVTWPEHGNSMRMPERGNYVVKLPAAPKGEIHFDLVVEGGVFPANLGRVGLRPWAKEGSDSTVPIIWAIVDPELL